MNFLETQYLYAFKLVLLQTVIVTHEAQFQTRNVTRSLELVSAKYVNYSGYRKL